MIDLVTRYATDVVEGRIVAGRLVRLACQRHLNDLAHAAEKGLVWKPEEAQRVIDFFADVLCLPEETAAEETIGQEIDPALREKRFGSVALERIVPASLNGSATLRFESGLLEYRLIIPYGNFETG